MLPLLHLTVYDIGKSFSLIYILVDNLLDAKPIIFQMKHNIAYLFCDRGVFSFDPSHWVGGGGIKWPCEKLGLTLGLKQGPLLLVDSNEQLISPPSFSLRHNHVFVVQAAKQGLSTAVQNGWIEQIEAKRHFMAPWSWSEIAAGNSLQPSPVKITFLRKVYENLPPSARICYETTDEGMLASKLDEVRSICCSTKDLDSASRLINNEGSRYKITCLWPNDSNGERDFYSYEFASTSIARLFCEPLGFGVDTATREALLVFPPFAQRIVMVFLFKDLAHKAFTDTFNTGQPPTMTTRFQSLGDTSRILSRKRWDPTIVTPFQFPSGHDVQSFPPSSGPVAILPGTYYQLDGTKRPSVDAFFINNNGQFTLLKMSIDERSVIKARELQELADGLPVELRQKRWTLLFVVPEIWMAFQASVDDEAWAGKLDMYVLELLLDSVQSSQSSVLDKLSRDDRHVL